MSQIILYDRAEDFSPEELLVYFKKNTFEEELVSRLKDTATYLLDGCRGSGKTMLMRVAEKELDKDFETSRILGVFVRFPRAIALEGATCSLQADYHPFRQWVFAKLLKSTIDKLNQLKVLAQTDLILETSSQKATISSEKLSQYIDKLEHTYSDQNAADINLNARLVGVTPEYLVEIDKPDIMREQIINLCRNAKISRIIFFLDEVAQNLNEEYQESFFSIVKHLRDQYITCKVAVYPHITSYGKDFDIGHDAIVLSLDRPSEDDDYLGFFRDIATQRVVGTELEEALLSNEQYLKLLIKASFGNPRALIHLLARLPIKNRLQLYEVSGVIKDYVEQELFKYLRGLKDRLHKHKQVINIADELIHLFIEDIKKSNYRSTTKTLFVAVSTQRAVPYRVHKAIDILVYAGLLSRRGSCKITSRESAIRYLINFGALIKENALADLGQTNVPLQDLLTRLTNPDRDRKKEYTKNSPELIEINNRSIEDDMLTCEACFHTVESEDKFCSNCGNKLKSEPLYQLLLSHPIEKLDLTPSILKRLVDIGGFTTIGDIINATDEELDSLPWVGPYRIRLIRYAAEEYISG